MTPITRANRSATRGLTPDSEPDSTTTYQSTSRAPHTPTDLVEGEEIVIAAPVY